MVRITDLNLLTTLEDNDQIAVVDVSADETKKASISLLTGDLKFISTNSSLAPANASGINTVAIGNSSQATAANCIQLGAGTNINSGTLQFRNTTIANTVGLQSNFGVGAPAFVAPTGSLYVDTQDNRFYFRSSNVWNSASGVDLVIASKGDLLTRSASANVALPVGLNDQILTVDSSTSTGLKWADAPASDSLLTTKGDLLTRGTSQDIRLGVGADGQILSANSSEPGGLEWVDNTAAGDPYLDVNSTGTTALATGTNSVAIGSSAVASALNSIQIGSGNNTVANSLRYGSNVIASSAGGLAVKNAAGLPTGAATAGSLYLNQSNSQLYVYNSGWSPVSSEVTDKISISQAGGAATTGNINNVAVGANSVATGPYATAIGSYAQSTGTYSIAIGSANGASTSAFASGLYSLAIGYDSIASASQSIAIGGDGAESTASKAIQLGEGVNNDANTLKYLNSPVANQFSIQANVQSTGSAPASAAPSGTIVVDTSGTGTLWVRVNSVWRSVGLT